MGPRLRSRGSRGQGEDGRGDDAASMGPRLRSRGSEATLTRGSAQLVLQWVRGCAAAVAMSCSVPCASCFCFNGSAAAQPR